MYIVTNREIDRRNNPEVVFGTAQNAKGIDELRIATAEKTDGKWAVTVEKESTSKEIKNRRSFKLFLELQKEMSEKKRNCVFFVHGYNVNFRDALDTAWDIEQKYDVEVILFSWPSRGGGEGKENVGKEFIGTASYKRDKAVAEQSKRALDRCLETLIEYIKIREMDCGQNFSLLVHSMGNYLLKKLTISDIYNAESLIFDNIVLCCADTNNENHEQWVDKLECRRRVYVTINENDFALKWSRRKLGDKQKARLGHYTRNLNSRNAIYLDFTEAKHVEDSHGYFHDEVVDKNKKVKDVFASILNGDRVERTFSEYDPERRVYHV